MKHIIILSAAFAVLAPTLATAQSLTISAPGYSSTKLFETAVGDSIGGLDFGASGDVYYLINTATDTKLQRRNAADGYVVATTLYTYNYGRTSYGSFVSLYGGKIYFGENAPYSTTNPTGTIRVHDIALNTDALLATVPNNYDFAIAPNGTAYLSAFSPTGNNVSIFDRTTGAVSDKLTSLDYSGPLSVDDLGRVYYGGTQYGNSGGIYRYTAAEFAAGSLTLDVGHKWVNNASNAYLAFNDNGSLWQTDFSGLGFYDTTSASYTSIGSSADSIGNLAADANQLLASVTDYGTAKSAVFRVVPEPTTALLALVGLAGLVVRRRRI